MKKYLTVLSSMIIMLCIGSLYAWSIIASELIKIYDFTGSQSQIIFGTLIAVYPVTMIFAGQLGKKIKHKYLGYISGILFTIGYLLASYSQGNFFLMFFGIGVLAGIGTGFGYWISLTAPVQWFPHKKGLVTGLSVAGFGLGAVLMSFVSERILASNYDVLQLLKMVAILYGVIIFILSNFVYQTQSRQGETEKTVKISHFIQSKLFKKLFAGILMGTFAGLIIVGSLKIIGGQYNISYHSLVLSVSLFSIANFFGRIIWGALSDYLGARTSIFSALFFQSIAIISLIIFSLSDASFLLLSFLIGFGFGGNFVLFAKETAQTFGLNNLGIIYPFVFVGHSIAGIIGPVTGGLLFDIFGSFYHAIILASVMSLAGGILFLIREQKPVLKP